MRSHEDDKYTWNKDTQNEEPHLLQEGFPGAATDLGRESEAGRKPQSLPHSRLWAVDIELLTVA